MRAEVLGVASTAVMQTLQTRPTGHVTHFAALSLTEALFAWLVAVVVDIGVEECLEAAAPAAVAARCCKTLQVQQSFCNFCCRARRQSDVRGKSTQQSFTTHVHLMTTASLSCRSNGIIHYLATMGVSPIVTGARTGSSALLHKNAKAMDELGPVRRFVNQPRSFGSASSLTCWSASSFQVGQQVASSRMYFASTNT